MTKPFEQRNQSDTARRKLKTLAAASAVDVTFATALANFTWDYDPKFRNEAIGWVENDKLSRTATEQLHFIAETVGLASKFELTRAQAAKELICAYKKQSSKTVWAHFYSTAASKNYARVSEFASHFYLRGLDGTNVKSLEWKHGRLTMVEIARNLFLKLFRGGSQERSDLDYLWCDLTIDLKYNNSIQSPTGDWLDKLLSAIESLPTKSSLKDLIGCCNGIIGGSKFFKQEVLESLTYADVLRVRGLPVSDMFLADRRNKLSPHFYSNEWSYPLRFWSTNGGSVNRAAIRPPKPA